MTLEGPGGADTDLAAIKRLFYDVDGNARPPDEASLEPGWRSLCRDMPLCRWPWEILPQHQRVVVVHEPQYILMFEKVLAGPAPHEYVHLLLPGGTDELGSDEFALRPGSKGAMAGTLVRIVASLRDTVQTATPGLKVEGLVLVVQGLARVHVTQQTQALPYAKADVLLLPDAEALGAAARASRRWLRRSGALARTDPAVRTRLALEAAAAEEAYWQRHELCNASLVASPTPKLCLLSSSHAEGRADGAAAAAVEAMERVPLLSPPPAADEGRVDAADLTVLLPDGAADSAFRNRSAWHSEWVRRLLDVVEDHSIEGEAQLGRQPALGGAGPAHAARRGGELDGADAAEEEASLRALEVQVWLSLDELVDPDAPRGEGASRRLYTDGDVPPELIGLLPPPPAGGWPTAFGMHTLLQGMASRARLEALVNGGSYLADLDGSAVGAGYPLRRRAARLSYAIWAVIGDEDGAPLQRVLEAAGTAERLRFALLRIRRLMGRSFRPPGT